MKKSIREGRVLKSSQPTLENMVRVLVEALKAEGFDAQASKNGGAKTTYVDVAEFEKNIEITLEKGAKYKIVPKMDEIDFDLEGKGMEAFKEDAEDLAKELATKLDKDYKDSDATDDDSSGNEFVIYGVKGNRKVYLCGSNTWKTNKELENEYVSLDDDEGFLSVFKDEAKANDALEKVAYKKPAIDFDDLGVVPKKDAFSEDDGSEDDDSEDEFVIYGYKGNRKVYLCGSNTWKSAKAAKNDLVSVFEDEDEANDVLEKVAYKSPAIEFDDIGVEPKKVSFSESKSLKEAYNEKYDVKLTTLEQVRKCLDNDITVYIDDIGPFGSGSAEVIDTTINSSTTDDLDEYTLEEFDVKDMDEFFEQEGGTKALVIDEQWGQSGCNFQYLDAYDVDDFDVYVDKAELEESGISLDDETSEGGEETNAGEDSEAQNGYVVKITMKGPTGEWDQVGYASHSDDVDFDEEVIGWDDIENVCAIPEAAAKELLGKIVAEAKPVEEFMFSIVPYNSER